MGFTIAFNLSHLSNGLPLHTRARIVCRNRLTLYGGFRKHIALGDIRVVRNSDKATVRTHGSVIQPLPQIFWVLTLVRTVGDVLTSLIAAIWGYHNTVQVGASGNRTPLPT